jgi:hypothetical protein
MILARISAPRTFEVAANIAIVAVAILLAVILVRRELAPGEAAARPPAPDLAGRRLHIPRGTEDKRSVVLVLSTTCHFCAESAPFYKRIIERVNRKSDAKILAILPQPTSDSQRYLARLGLDIPDVRQVSLRDLGITATPSIVLLEPSGRVARAWTGLLNPEREKEVLSSL